MKNIVQTSRRNRLAWLAAGLCLVMVHGPVQARTKKVSYVPGITLTPDLLMADAQTPRTYSTPQGTSLWHEGLPVQQGDRMKLNVFVATGGADLSEVKVRLDNVQIADVSAAPWNDTIDTTSLTAGYHMLEVWALATGDPAQSSTKQLSFYVVKDLPAQYAVKGIQQQYTGGQVSTVTSDEPPALPAFLAGHAVDAEANVTLGSRDAALPASAAPVPVGAEPVTINDPTLFSVRRASGGTATQFAYALVRDGSVILSSDAPLSLISPTRRTLIKIQKRTDTEVGLRSGTVVLWVWGVNAQGNPGNPSRSVLQFPELCDTMRVGRLDDDGPPHWKVRRPQ